MIRSLLLVVVLFCWGSLTTAASEQLPASPVIIFANNITATSASLSSGNDTNWFIFYAEAGFPYEIKIEDNSVSSTIDPQIEVFNDQGAPHQLSVPFNFGFEGEGELLSLNAFSTSGFYFIKITTVTDGSGSYQLRVNIPIAPQGSIMKGIVIDACTQNVIETASILISTRFTRTYQGQFYISPVNPGTHSVTITADGYQDAFLTVEMSDLTIVNETIELTPQGGCDSTEPPLETAEIAGQVIDECTGNVIAGAMISSDELSVTTTANGEYLLQGLLLGNHSILVTAPGYSSTQLSVELNQADQRVTRDVQLVPQAGCTSPKPETAELVGQVIDACTGDAIADAMISSNQLSVTNTANGDYLLPGLLLGNHSIIFAAQGYISVLISVDFIQADQRVNRNVQLVPQTGCPLPITDNAAVANEGLWLIPSEPGSGFDIGITGNNDLYLVWYTYTLEGLPHWYLASGPLNGSNWNADVFEYTWDGMTATSSKAGDAALNFQDNTHATLNWNLNIGNGSADIEYFVFDQGSNVIAGTWFEASQPGYGLTQVNQGATQVKVLYFYDQAGNPRWALGSSQPATAAITNMDTYTGSCPVCPFEASVASPAGTVTTVYFDQSSGVLSTTIDLPPPLFGSWLIFDATISNLSE